MKPLSGRSFTTAFLLLLVVTVGASYSDCFGVGFYFDDRYGILDNTAIRSLLNIPSFFVNPYACWAMQGQEDMRPVLLVTYALNYAMSGIEPWSYHALNLLLHLVASALVFVLVRDHVWWPVAERGPNGTARVPAAAAALFFALAPLNSQPVVYLWARSALLCVTLYLGAFLAYLRQRRLLGSTLLVLALLTKAIAVTLPVVLVAYDFIYRDRMRYRDWEQYVRDWRRLTRPIGVPLLLVALYLAYRVAVLPAAAPETRKEAWVTPSIWFMSQWSALVYYVRLFVWPDGLSMDHDFAYTTNPLTLRAAGALSTLGLWVWGAVRVARRYPQVAFATAWFFITLAPESSFSPLGEVINDHRPYIAASLGLSVLLVWIVEQAAARCGSRRRVVFIVVVALACCAAVPFNRYRTWQWGDAFRIWDDTTRKSPNNARAWMNAGQMLVARGDLTVARPYLERARELNPRYAQVYMNLSVLAAREGQLDEALRWAQQAVELAPAQGQGHYYLGQAYQWLGQRDEAMAAYRRAVELNPRDAASHQALAALGGSNSAGPAAIAAPADEVRLMADGLAALQKARDPARAAELFRQVLAHNPTHYGATYQLALALDQTGQAVEARALWEKVLEMAVRFDDPPTAQAARTRLARDDAVVAAVEVHMRAGLDALYTRHDAPAAVSEFRQVLEHNPTHYGATYQLATALDTAGQRDEARRLWERVLEMAERYSDAPTAATARSRLAGN